jgi:hypothetical protein
MESHREAVPGHWKESLIYEEDCRLMSKCLKKIVLAALVVVLGIWTMPPLIISPQSGLDASWMIGMNLALLKQLRFGEDIVFTFGPLGFLYAPYYIDFTLWAISSTFSLAAHFLFFFVILLLLSTWPARWTESLLLVFTAAFVLTVIIGLPFPYIDYKLCASALILLYLVMTDKIQTGSSILLLAVSSILFATASLIKFSAALISVSSIAVGLACFVHRRKTGCFLCLLLVYLSALPLLWKLSGQELPGLPLYILRSFEISSGYSAGMAYPGRSKHLYYGIGYVGVIGFIGIMAIIKRWYHLSLFFLLCFGYLLVTFKHGFVRMGGGAYILIYLNVALFLSLMYLVSRRESTAGFRCAILVSCLILLAIMHKYPMRFLPSPAQQVHQIKWYVSLMTDTSRRSQVADSAKKAIAEMHPLEKESLLYLEDRSVDIIPWEVSIAYAYDLNWAPRPVFQSFVAYTEKLDLLNAGYFQGNGAPDRILYAYQSIDERYPIFDEPATFSTVLYHYDVHDIDGEFIILAKKADRSRIEKRGILSQEAYLGEIVPVPAALEGHLFAEVRMEYSWIGKVMRWLYKPSQASIRLATSGGVNSKEFRFIPENAKNGLFISQYVGNTGELSSVLRGNIDKSKRIEKLMIKADKPWHYKRKVSIDFIAAFPRSPLEKPDYR